MSIPNHLINLGKYMIMPCLSLNFGDVACIYWQSPKGYFFKQYEGQDKITRVSSLEYISAYETLYGI